MRSSALELKRVVGGGERGVDTSCDFDLPGQRPFGGASLDKVHWTGRPYG